VEGILVKALLFVSKDSWEKFSIRRLRLRDSILMFLKAKPSNCDLSPVPLAKAILKRTLPNPATLSSECRPVKKGSGSVGLAHKSPDQPIELAPTFPRKKPKVLNQFNPVP